MFFGLPAVKPSVLAASAVITAFNEQGASRKVCNRVPRGNYRVLTLFVKSGRYAKAATAFVDVVVLCHCLRSYLSGEARARGQRRTPFQRPRVLGMDQSRPRSEF